MASKERHVFGVDVGTSRVRAVVGQLRGDGGLDVIGLGVAPASGIKKGTVANVDATVESIRAAVEEAELMAGVSVDRAFVGVGGPHVKGLNSRGIIAVHGHDRTVVRDDIRRALDGARTVTLPADRAIYHVLPQEYTVDDQEGIDDPLGMSGSRLEVRAHIVAGSAASQQNLVNCLNRAGIEVEQVVLQPLATAHAVLTPDERRLGVLVVDVGAGTVELAVLARGALWHTAVLPVGGEHFTNDIAVGLRTPIAEAERIKQHYGCALASLVDADETIEVPSVGGRPAHLLSRRILGEIVQARAEEVCAMVARDIRRSGFEQMIHAGVVLTGGGAQLDGLPDVVEQILDLPVRVAAPTGVGGLVDVVAAPEYSTVVGLLLYGLHNRRTRTDSPSLLWRMSGAVREFLSGLF